MILLPRIRIQAPVAARNGLEAIWIIMVSCHTTANLPDIMDPAATLFPAHIKPSPEQGDKPFRARE